MLKSRKPNGADTKFSVDVHGEICETVLECLIYEYCKNNKKSSKGWRLEKSLILKDLASKNKDYYTELDLVLFAPQGVLGFECKSYQGPKTLTGNGVLQNSYHSFDVYKQHKTHMDVLASNFDYFRKKTAVNSKPYSMYLFNFSLGAIEDHRPVQYQKLMPVLEVSDVPKILGNMKEAAIVWDIALVNKALDTITQNSEMLHQKHLEYVKGMKHNEF